MTINKPIFLPLKTEHYNRFESGEKCTEFRLYGPRWNEEICAPGRSVTLSKGYGKQNRMIGRIVRFYRKRVSELNERDQADVRSIYGDNPGDIACIVIEINACEQ